MNKEHKFVIKPLLQYLEDHKNQWQVHIPKYPTSATGWDIEARSKNLDLLIEAKFMSGPFLSKLNGLVTSPLARRKRHYSETKKPFVICWALGAKIMRRNPFQLLWDYFVRNPIFWKHYHKDLKVKYIFLVNRGVVSRMDFSKFLSIAPEYKKLTKNTSLNVRREVATMLISKHFKRVYKIFYQD